MGKKKNGRKCIKKHLSQNKYMCRTCSPYHTFLRVYCEKNKNNNNGISVMSFFQLDH